MTTVAEASSAAARLLEIATRNADELVDGAKDEADKIVGAARTKAERLETETQDQDRPARVRCPHPRAMLDSETEARRKEIFGNLEKEKDQLNTEIEGLRAFEREYRSRLKSYFTQQLETLDGNGDAASPAHARRPRASTRPSGSARSWARSPGTAEPAPHARPAQPAEHRWNAKPSPSSRTAKVSTDSASAIVVASTSPAIRSRCSAIGRGRLAVAPSR